MSNASAPILAKPLPRPWIGVGEVRHARLRPVRHAFCYPTFFLMLPLRSLRAQPSDVLPRNRAGWVSFQDRDHGDGGEDCLAWLEALLLREGVDDAEGEVWLHCLPRVLGYAFKPVSFWYCHRQDGSLTAIVVEVHNTFGEKHVYLLRDVRLAWGRLLEVRKAFHVSPFCEVEGRYHFRFWRDALVPVEGQAAQGAAMQPRTVARIEHHDASGCLLVTSVSGHLSPLSAARLRSVFWQMPLLTLGVTARIHWQAFLLWVRRVPFFTKPEPPATSLSHGRASPDPATSALP